MNIKYFPVSFAFPGKMGSALKSTVPSQRRLSGVSWAVEV